jgi:hypothetical protein
MEYPISIRLCIRLCDYVFGCIFIAIKYSNFNLPPSYPYTYTYPQRLFGGSTETMDYKSIATAVFTPLELGTVGLTEMEAQEVGADFYIIFYYFL